MNLTQCTVQLCPASSDSEVKRFINDHWRTNHILSRDSALFNWQHFDAQRPGYAFAIARDSAGVIQGILGYIRDDFFRRSHSPSRPKTLWLAIWKVLQAAGRPGLGLKLRAYVEQVEEPALIAVLGINARTVPLYRAFGYNVRPMEQFYLVNTTCREPVLIQAFDGRYDSGAESNPDRHLIQLEQNELSQFVDALSVPADVLPVRDSAYIHGRYVNHPSYCYKFYGIRQSGTPLALFVTRRAHAKGVAALRIVDFVGSEIALPGIRSQLQAVLITGQLEYADFHCCGVSRDIMESAGFLFLDPNRPLVVPNHFEPFTTVNPGLTVAHKLRGTYRTYRYIAYKGDGDQDRPSESTETRE